MIQYKKILMDTFVLVSLLLMMSLIAEAEPFRTRSVRGTHTIPEGYGPRGPVGPSDTEITVESPAAIVDGAGNRDTPYQAYPPDDSEAFRLAVAEVSEIGRNLCLQQLSYKG